MLPKMASRRNQTPPPSTSVGSRALVACLFDTGCQRCPAPVIGRRLLVTSAVLALLLLYCVVSPPILQQRGPGWWTAAGRRSPRDVVLVSDGGPGRTASVCVRRLSPDLLPGPGPAASSAVQQITFLPGVKNPCWLQELIQADYDSLRSHVLRGTNKKFRIKLQERARLYQPFVGRALRVRCLPFVYVIGQPKCATTDLHHRVSLHPHLASRGVCKSHGHWWSRGRFQSASAADSLDSERHPESFREYVDSFELVADQLVGGGCGGDRGGDEPPWTPSSQMITMDVSTSAMWDGRGHRLAAGSPLYPPLGRTVAAGLAAVQPAARIIAILRDPVERLFSDYLYFHSDQDQHKGGDEFHQMSLQAVEGWTNCTSTRTEDDCSTDHTVLAAFRVRLHVSLYVVYLQRWLQAFGRQQLLVLRTEDYKRNVTDSLQKIFAHLELESPPAGIWEQIRDAKPMNVRRKNTTQKAMLPATRQMLHNFYRPYNRRLAELLGSERYLWDDVGGP